MSGGLFFGINIGVKALRASQTALSVTGHNLANANTPGYSRQVANMHADFAIPVPSNNRWVGAGQLGTGVVVGEVKRVRDQFIDWQIRNETGIKEEWKARHDTLSQIETVFLEPSDTGLSTLMGKFWDSWQELSKFPESSPVRTTVKETGVALAEAFRHSYERLETIGEGLERSMEIAVSELNSITKQIASLNEQIKFITSGGHNPNDLLDQRDLLLDRLAELVDIEVTPVFANVAGKSVATGEVRVAINIEKSDSTIGITDMKITGTSEYDGNYALTIFYDEDDGKQKAVLTRNGKPIEGVDPLDVSGGGEHTIGDITFTINEDDLPGKSDPAFTTNFTVTPGDEGASIVTAKDSNFYLIDPKPGDHIKNLKENDPIFKNGYREVAINPENKLELGLVTGYEKSSDGKNDNSKPITETIASISGEISGIQMTGDKDGEGSSQLNYYKDKLDKLATGLAEILNNIHKEGITLKEGENSTGIVFFEFRNEKGELITDPEKFSAKNFYINKDIEKDVGYIAAGRLEDLNGELIDPNVTEFHPGNRENALLIAELRNARFGLDENGKISADKTGDLKFDTFYQNFVSEIGVSVKESEGMIINQTHLITQLTNRKEAASGVSVDEETANMIAYNRAFQAAARYIKVLDELTLTVVNGLKA